MGFYYGQPANIRHYNNGTAEIVLENGTTLPLRWYYGNAPSSNQPRRDGNIGIWWDSGEGYYIRNGEGFYTFVSSCVKYC